MKVRRLVLTVAMCGAFGAAAVYAAYSVITKFSGTLSAPAPRHFLAISGRRDPLEINERAEVLVEGATYTVTRIAKWSGLMRDPRGIPAAAATLDATTLFLASGVWQTCCGAGVPPAISSAVYFQWHPADPDAARQASNAPLPGLESARWGVIDRGAANWFQSFTPGAGATLSTGVEVTLVAFDKDRPAVAVEIDRAGSKEIVTVAANEIHGGVPVRFDYPALAPRVYTLHAWEDGRALVAAFKDRQPAGQTELQAGQSFMGLHLEDIQSSAVYVSDKESNLWAAHLQSPSGQTIVLRQGEARRFADSLVEYKRVTSPGAVN